MKKNKTLTQWLWKWHFIAGIISLPVVLLLCITGGIYLFKATYEAPLHEPIKKVAVSGSPMSYQQQWEIANKNAVKKPLAMVLPTSGDQATQFVSGKFSGKSSLYVNPYNGQVSGVINENDGLMYTVRKLHGELLMGGFGTKIVELVASWMVVLILTGIYIFWPGRVLGIRGFFIPRTRMGKRIFFRDLHAISGFWMSALLLLVLAGAFPWTDVVGDNFKWVQKVTNTGYPATWEGVGITSEVEKEAISLDKMVAIASELDLPGEVSIEFPKGEEGIFSVSNVFHPDIGAQKKYHFDQYSGQQILQQNWGDVGILMRGRMWVMAFHQGQFGPWNWYLMLFIALMLAVISSSAIISYVLRKRKGSWGVPKVPSRFNAGYGIIAFLVILGIVFPLFGLSLLVILAANFLAGKFPAASRERAAQ